MKKHWWNSLRVRIVAWSFVPTAIILFAVAWFTFYSYQRVIGDTAVRQDWAVVQSKTRPIFEAFVDLANPTLIRAIIQVDVKKADPLAVRAQTILDETPGLDIFDGGIFFLDRQGTVVKTWPEQPDLLGQDWSGTPHFRFVIDHPGRAADTDLTHIGSSGKEILCSAVALNGPQGEFVGAAYFCFTVHPATRNAYHEAFGRVFGDLGLGPNTYMVDGNQRVIFSTDPSQVGRDLSGEDYLQQLLQGEGASRRFRIGQEDVLVSYAPVWPFSSNLVLWNLIKEESWADVMRPSLPYRQLLLALLALGVIVPVLVTAYGVRHITNPIQKLIRAAEQVTAGQFKHRIEVKTGDEIEALADQFNLMSAELDESYASLERKVADRTRELATLNAITSVASHSLEIEEILADALNQTVEQMGYDAGVAFKFEEPVPSLHSGQALREAEGHPAPPNPAPPNPAPPLLMAHRGFEPDAAVELVSSYALAGRGAPAAYPEEVTAWGAGDFPGRKLRDRLSQYGYQSLVYIPLSAKGRRLGFFILGRHEPGQLLAEELTLLSAIGKQVGVAMENARLYEQAEFAATTAERTRLARELHDAVTQTLFSANLIADVVPRIWRRNPEEGMQNLEELRQLTRGALAEMRTLLLEMRPESLERADLKSLLTQLADAFVGRVRTPVSLAIQGDCALTHDVKLVFYRVAQEALNNIAKHSGARQVELSLACQAGQTSLSIKDDGLGFEPGSLPPGHMGIAIMRERAASIGAGLMIESQVGRGTTVTLEWKSAGKGSS